MDRQPLTAGELDFLHGLFDQARGGGAAALGHALDSGVPVNLTNADGDSLLMLAAYHGHADSVRLLLHHGADTERINDHGQTALGAAVFRQHVRIVWMLLAAGADRDTGTPSAREIATFFRLEEMSTLLAEALPYAVLPTGGPDIRNAKAR
jgi:ankyrin repeat protein